MVTALINSLPFEFLKKDFFISALQIFIGSLFLALCAQISIPLYFSPVPLSAQTFGVMFIGATLGSRKGFFTVLAYLAEGSLGLPVFAAGSAGIMSLFGLRGGYLLGFLFQAYLVGLFMEKQKVFQMTKTFSFLLFSCLLPLGLGSMWLSLVMNVELALILGFYPFIVGEMIKSAGLSLYLQLFHKKL